MEAPKKWLHLSVFMPGWMKMEVVEKRDRTRNVCLRVMTRDPARPVRAAPSPCPSIRGDKGAPFPRVSEGVTSQEV